MPHASWRTAFVVVVVVVVYIFIYIYIYIYIYASEQGSLKPGP